MEDDEEEEQLPAEVLAYVEAGAARDKADKAALAF